MPFVYAQPRQDPGLEKVDAIRLGWAWQRGCRRAAPIQRHVLGKPRLFSRNRRPLVLQLANLKAGRRISRKDDLALRADRWVERAADGVG